MMIGQWFGRFYNGTDTLRGKWHLAESEIAGRLITRCGRQLPDREDTETRWDSGPADDDRCYQCRRDR